MHATNKRLVNNNLKEINARATNRGNMVNVYAADYATVFLSFFSTIIPYWGSLTAYFYVCLVSVLLQIYPCNVLEMRFCRNFLP